jgi:hypothetical protein
MEVICQEHLTKRGGTVIIVFVSLADLVTNALSGKEVADESIEDLLCGKSGSALDEGRAAEKLLSGSPHPDDVRRALSRLVVLYAQSRLLRRYRVGDHNAGVLLAALLFDYLETGRGLEEIRTFVWETNNLLQLRAITSSEDMILAEIADLWGEDTAGILAEMVSVSQATVRRWYAGSQPSAHNLAQIHNIASAVYQFRCVCGKSDQETRDIFSFSQPELGGRSAAEVFAGARYAHPGLLPGDLRNWLRSLGSHI